MAQHRLRLCAYWKSYLDTPIASFFCSPARFKEGAKLH